MVVKGPCWPLPDPPNRSGPGAEAAAPSEVGDLHTSLPVRTEDGRREALDVRGFQS